MKNLAMFQSVDPEHLAYAFGVAMGAGSGKMASQDPTHSSVLLETGDDIEKITFTDTPMNKALLSVTREMKTLIPGDDTESFQKRSAVMMRVWAIEEALPRRILGDRIRQREDGSFFLDSSVLHAFATAPLDSKTGHFKKLALIKILQSSNVPPECLSLTVELPSEMIIERT